MAGRTGDECVVRASAPELRDGVLRWSGTLRADRRHRASIEVTWDGRRYRESVRPWLLAFLPVAMRSGRRRLVVDGPVDAGTLDHLREWQELHHRWWPKSTRVLELRADVAPEPKVRRGAGAVTAFSGGVDSAFTLLRHRPGAPAGPYRQTELAAGLMVHGFDISHGDDDWFPEAFARSRRMLEAHGVAALRMRTDLRHVLRRAGLGWGKVAHGPALAAALACVEQAHDVVVLPSSYPYEHHAFRWGSTPIADHLLGSGLRPFWHDGAAQDKLDKVVAIAHDPAIAADLRVCFMGGQHDRNCGTCFKCLSTQACFWLAGVDEPAAFPRRATFEELAGIELRDAYKVALGRRIVRFARKRGRDGVADAFTTALARAGSEVPA